MVKSNKELKVNLNLLKRLVDELQSSLTAAENLLDNKESPDATEYVVSMSKCAGLAAGVVTESTLVVGDIQAAIKLNTAYGVPASGGNDGLSSLLDLVKGIKGSEPESN